MQMRFWQTFVRMDWILNIAVFGLLLLGFASIYSVELARADGFGLIQKHLIALAIGMVLFLGAVRMHYAGWRIMARGVYVASAALLVAVLLFGATIRGTTGWFNLGFFSFQPVEFAKFALVLQLARYFGEEASPRISWREIFWSGGMMFGLAGLVLMQPDLGSASILVALWGFGLLLAGISWKHLLIFATSFLLLFGAGWLVLEDYQKERIAVFMQPERDPLGSGYNIRQAKIAIGSGQVFGQGLGFGSQNQLRFLPEAQTDFVFSVIAEELGFFGASMVLLAFAVIAWRSYVIAHRARDGFGVYLPMYAGSILVIQALMNVAVNLALLPATGFALPFVSYGGSSLLLSLLLVGILQSVAIQQNPADIQSVS
jgi:rod shape determining protein RodA